MRPRRLVISSVLNRRHSFAVAATAALAVVLSLLAPQAATAVVTGEVADAVVTDVAVSASANSAGLASTAVADAGIVKTSLVGFDPANIISDALFYDGAAMTAAEIQAFLDQKIGSCRNGKCLNIANATIQSRAKFVSQTTGQLVCDAVQGGTMRASELIYRMQAACGISAKVILVTLQKEQGLVTSKQPSEWNIRAAMGMGCPDGAPCSTVDAGLGLQIANGVEQMKKYKATAFGRQPGRQFVGYNPNADCGGTYIDVANYATAALYNYTPYQPNAAALNAGYGLGDSCSSYGNRNFYNYYTDWFGSAQGDVLQVLQVVGTSERYLVSQGQRWRLGSSEVAAQYTWISSVRDVPRAEVEAYADRGEAPRAVRTLSGIVYVLDSGQRLRARDVAQVSDFGWDYNTLPVASDGQAQRYRDGGWLERAVRSGGEPWLIQSGSRREVADMAVLPRFGIPALTSEISAAMLGDYEIGYPVAPPGVYRDASLPYRLQTDAGVYTVPDAASGTAVARSARPVTVDSYAQMRSSGYMPIRMTSAGRSYVFAEDGWLRVESREFPAELAFDDLPAGAAAGLPQVGSESGPFFLRERSDPRTYLVSGGALQAVSSADQTWITRTYGVPPRVWTVLDGVVGDATAAAGLVRTSSNAYYLLDGVRASRLRDCAQVQAWGGNCASLPVVAAADLARYVDAGGLRDLVRTAAGTTWLVQGGMMRQVLDAGLLSVYGIPSSVSAVSTAVASSLPTGEPVLGAGVYSDGAAGRIVATPAGEFTLNAGQSLGVIATSARRLTAASYAAITVDGAMPTRLLSDNRAFVLSQDGWLEVPAASYGGTGSFTRLPSGAFLGITIAAVESRPHFVRESETGDEYLVSGGFAQPVAGTAEREFIARTYGVPQRVWSLVSGALEGIRIVPDMIVKDAAGVSYLVDGGTRYRLSGCPAVAEFGMDCTTVRTLSATQLATLRDGGALAPLLRSPDGFVWLVQSATRREVPDPRVLAVYGIGGSSTPVSQALIARLRLGQPVAGPGLYDDGTGDVRIVTGDGRVFALSAAGRIGTVMSGAWRMSTSSVDLLTTEGSMPSRISTATGTYILTSEGWLAVSTSSYTPLTFASVGGRANEGIISAGADQGPHFVREFSSTRVHLASGGLTPVADEATRAWISATYGVPAKVWIVADGALQ